MGFEFFAWNCEELAWKGHVFLVIFSDTLWKGTKVAPAVQSINIHLLRWRWNGCRWPYSIAQFVAGKHQGNTLHRTANSTPWRAEGESLWLRKFGISTHSFSLQFTHENHVMYIWIHWSSSRPWGSKGFDRVFIWASHGSGAFILKGCGQSYTLAF